MFVDLVGRFISGPLANQQSQGRVPQPVDWPTGEDGVILLRIVDENDAPVVLNITNSDSVTLSIGVDFVSGTRLNLVGVAGDPGTYKFTLSASASRGYSGPYVYEIRATKSGKAQQICAVAYWTFSPTVNV